MSLNAYSFADEMQQARDCHAYKRHKGTNTSRPQFAKRPPVEDTPENRLYAELASLRSELHERDNTIAVLRAHGGAEPEPIVDEDPWGAEFDRLSGKAQRQGLPSLPSLPPQDPDPPARTKAAGVTAMTKTQYLAALKKLGLTVASQTTAAALGVKVRQCQKYAAGHVAVPETVALLIAMYLKHGVPAEEE